jgi:hypothetical protein
VDELVMAESVAETWEDLEESGVSIHYNFFAYSVTYYSPDFIQGECAIYMPSNSFIYFLFNKWPAFN